MQSELFGDDLPKLFPIVEPDCTDSGTFDNVLEFLLMTGRTLQEAVMMMIPEAWQNHETMPEDKRAFYEYQQLPDGAVGRPGVDRRSPTASTSAPCSTATACGPRATTSRTTTA